MTDSTETTEEGFDQSTVDEAVHALKEGGIILYPTDTIWGLGCDPFDNEAVNRLRDIKGRSNGKPFILLVASMKQLKKYINKIHPRVETLLNHHQRPLSVVYRSVRRIPDYLKADDGSVAIRIVQDAFCREMISKFDKPVISTSANKTGEEFPAHFGAISSDVIEAVDHVVKYRQEDRKEAHPSTIATYDSGGELEFLRE